MKRLFLTLYAALLFATPVVAVLVVPASAADDYPSDQTLEVQCPNMPDDTIVRVVIRNKKFSYSEHKYTGQTRFDKKAQMSVAIFRKIKQLPNDHFRFDSTSNYVVYYHDV